jgi:hypothetical protein
VPEVVKVQEKPSQANAALIEGEFFATPEPRVRLGDVSPQNAEDKHRFEAERLKRWFGG